MRSTFPYSPRFSGSPVWYSANLMLDEPPLMVRTDCIDSLSNGRRAVLVGLFMGFIFSNLALRLKPRKHNSWTRRNEWGEHPINIFEPKRITDRLICRTS